MHWLELEPWDLVWSDVTNYNRDALHAAITETFVGLEQVHGPLVDADKPTKKSGQNMPPRPRWKLPNGDENRLIREPLTVRLRAEFPRWYARGGWFVGNETFGGCFCHSLPSALTSGASAGADWVVNEVEQMLTLLREWAPLIERVEFAKNSDDKLELARASVLAMVDAMIDHGWVSESWYRYVDDGVRWMIAAATDMPIDSAAVRDLCSHDFAFTSWTAPDSAQKEKFAEAAALVLAG